MSEAKRGSAVAQAGAPHLRMLIGGEWRTGSPEAGVIDPYRGEIVAHAP